MVLSLVPPFSASAADMVYLIESEEDFYAMMDEPFADVTETGWYYKQILWAYSNNVVNGMSANTFEPDAKITRDQIATILMRYLTA